MTDTLTINNIYTKLQEARVRLQNMHLKKSGKNTFAKFSYYELSDFLPQINEILTDLKLCENFSIDANGMANLTIINAENPSETIYRDGDAFQYS